MIKEEIKKIIKKAAGIEAPDFSVEIPGDKNHGDYSTNIALILAKKVNKNPREVAEEIKNQIDDLQATITETAGAINPPTYSASSTTTEATIVPSTHNKLRTTQYFYGAGFAWSENLYFDILNFSGANDGTDSAGLLDLGAWRMGLTFIF